MSLEAVDPQGTPRDIGKVMLTIEDLKAKISLPETARRLGITGFPEGWEQDREFLAQLAQQIPTAKKLVELILLQGA